MIRVLLADDQAFVHGGFRALLSAEADIKDTEPAELIHAVRTINTAEAPLSPRITRRLIAQVLALPSRTTGPPPELRLVVIAYQTGLVAPGAPDD